MNILHLATNDFGGAGKASLRIHSALQDEGVNSTLLVKNKGSSNSRTFSVKRNTCLNFLNKLWAVALRRLKYSNKYSMYSMDKSAVNIVKSIVDLNLSPDVVVLHWISGFVTINDITQIKKKFNCEIFWYAMDMSPFTGGCHFSWGCDEYKNSCQKCPAVKNILYKNIPNEFFLNKRQALIDANVSIIAPNKWVRKQVVQSALQFNKIELCYLPLSKLTFVPREKGASKEFRIFFGAQNISDVRKGAEYFIKAMEELKEILEKKGPHIFTPIIVLPGLVESEIDALLPFDVKRVPYASTEEKLSRMYQSSDVFICTSIEDSGPMMVCESLMSGVPVIGFKMGICPELITDGYNGYVIELKNSKKLANTIYQYSRKSMEERRVYSQNARQSVVSLMSFEAHSEKLLSIISNKTID